VTPVYAAPETFEGYVSRYTDQYSLAIVFQELLTGTRPFNGANTKQLLMQHLNGMPDLEPLPLADRPIIGRALEKKPDARWPSCTDLVRALKQPATTYPAAKSAPISPVVRPGATTPLPGQEPRTPLPTENSSHVITRPVVIAAGMAGTVTMPRPGLTARATTGVTTPPAPTTGGLPSLVTPKLVTPGAAQGTDGIPAVTVRQPVSTVPTVGVPSGPAPAEKTGPGVLFPAYAVAVGQTGLLLLRKFRAAVREKFGPGGAPHLRTLFIDTDPAAAALAADGPDRLAESETFIARLNRPQHYFQRDGLPPVEPWLPAGSLYQLPKNPGPANGVRAFGRLALIDNVRPLLERVRKDFDASFTTDEALTAATAATGLGLRSNRAKILIFSGLAGGTGGGMVLDLAFLLKQELRRLGYARPECRGYFLVPPADPRAPRTPGLGNTYAALAELSHYHRGRARYQCRFDTATQPVIDSEGPFARLHLTPLPARPDDKQREAAAGLLARHAFLECFTQVGRVLDEARQEADLHVAGPTVASAAQFRLLWPRRELLAVGTERLVQKLIQRWTGKESGHLKEPVQQWLDEQWAKRNLDLEAVVDKFNATVKDQLREEPDRVFDAFVDPLKSASASAGQLTAEATVSVLEQLLQLVGKPDSENELPGTLQKMLVECQKKLVREVEGHMATLAVSLIEQTQYRLPGAEECLAQLDARLDRVMEGLDGVRNGLEREVKEHYARLFPLIGGLAQGATRRTALTSDLIEHLRHYPRKRLKLHVLDNTLSLYRMMKGMVPEYLREVNFCRGRLGELASTLGAAAAANKDPVGPGRLVLPHGVAGLTEAADMLLVALAPDDLVAFDQAVQTDVLKQFRGVVNVCVKGAEHAAAFQALLLRHAETFLSGRMESLDPASALMRFRGDATEKLSKLLTDSFDAAAPELGTRNGKPTAEVAVLAVGGGADGAEVRSRASGVVPIFPLLLAEWADGIAFVREYPAIPVGELPQMGPAGREAYETLSRTDHPPHTRADVEWLLPE
jgi:eukaryotic-like serine/threonine-protein kinase